MLIVFTSCSSLKSIVVHSSSKLEVESRLPKIWQLENLSFKVAVRNLHPLEEFGGEES